MKTILSILFLFVCAFAHAQYHNVEGIRVVGRSDSTTIPNVGQIQFDADDDKFRFNDGTGWFSYLKEGATLPYWPLSGNFSTTGAQSITVAGTTIFVLSTPTGSLKSVGAKTSPAGEFAAYTINESTSGSVASIGIGGTTPNTNSILYFDPYNIWLRSPSGGGVTFYDDRTIQKGIEYSTPRDSTDWTPHTLTTKAYVDGKFDGIQVPEGANKTMGTATLSAGTVTVNTTAVTANSRIFLTINGGTLTNVGTPYVSARSAGTSFTITSTNGSDASDVAWIIINPAP